MTLCWARSKPRVEGPACLRSPAWDKRGRPRSRLRSLQPTERPVAPTRVQADKIPRGRTSLVAAGQSRCSTAIQTLSGHIVSIHYILFRALKSLPLVLDSQRQTWYNGQGIERMFDQPLHRRLLLAEPVRSTERSKLASLLPFRQAQSLHLPAAEGDSAVPFPRLLRAPARPSARGPSRTQSSSYQPPPLDATNTEAGSRLAGSTKRPRAPSSTCEGGVRMSREPPRKRQSEVHGTACSPSHWYAGGTY